MNVAGAIRLASLILPVAKDTDALTLLIPAVKPPSVSLILWVPSFSVPRASWIPTNFLGQARNVFFRGGGGGVAEAAEGREKRGGVSGRKGN